MVKHAYKTRSASRVTSAVASTANAPHFGTSTRLAAQGRMLNATQRVGAPPRAAGSLRAARLVQGQQIGELIGDASDGAEIARRLGHLIVNHPGDDEAEQNEFHHALVQAARSWRRLGHKRIGTNGDDKRIDLIAALMEADASPELRRVIAYCFGRARLPERASRGIGTLVLARNGDRTPTGVEGRPDLFAIATGGASQARRHITAWHTLRNVMNRIIARFGANDLAAIWNDIVELTDPAIRDTALAIANREAPGDEVARHIISLAVVLNNVPHNLWLGAARENIAINTLNGHLVRWTVLMSRREMPLGSYRRRVAKYPLNAPMVRRVVALLLNEIDQAVHNSPNSATAYQTVIGYAQHTIRPMLEIDPRRGSVVDPIHLVLYQFGEGTRALHTIDEVKNALAIFVRSSNVAD